jgi:hypothetical protein
MKNLYYYILSTIIILLFTQCKTLLPVPSDYRGYTVEESKNIIERVLNLQYKHTPTSVYVTSDCYKVSYASALLTSSMSIPNTRMVHKFIYYDDIGVMKLYQYPHCYNLVIYNRKGHEINKVISKNLYDLQQMIYAIRSLQ